MPDTEPDDPEPAQGQTYPVSVWDVHTGTVIQTLHQPLHRFSFGNEAALSQSGDLVAINNGAEIRVWNVDDGTLRYQLPLGDTLFSDLLFSSDAALLAVSDRGREVVQMWSLRDGSLVRTLGADGGSPNGMAFSPDGHLLALHHGRTVTIWRVADGARQRTLETTWIDALLTPSLAFSPDGHVLVVGGMADDQPTVAELWRVSDGVVLHTFHDTQADATDTVWHSAVAFSADGTRLMTATLHPDETADVALLWNVQDGRLLRRFDPAIGIRDLRFAPNDTEVLVTDGPYLFALPADGPAE